MDTLNLIAVQIIQDDVAVRIDHHDTGMRTVDIRHLRTGEIVNLAGIQRDALNSAFGRDTREIHTMHPGAGFAHAQRTAAVDKDGRIQIERVLIRLGVGGDGEPGTGGAGHNSGHAGKRVLAMRIVTAVFAGDIQRHMLYAAHDLGHCGRIGLGHALYVGFGGCRTIGLAERMFHLDGFQLPVAGSLAGTKRTGGKGQQQAKRKDAQDFLHDGNSFPCAKDILCAFPVGKK